MADSIVHPGNPVNDATNKVHRNRSHFEMRPDIQCTNRFGEYHPHFVFEGVPNDKNIRLLSQHDVRSYTLKSPMMGDVMLKQDYFAVPYRALLPLNWEKIVKNPNVGDDINASLYGLSVSDGLGVIKSFFDRLFLSIFHSTVTVSDEKYFCWVMSMVVWFNKIFSSGSLANQLGYSFFDKVTVDMPSSYGRVDIDKWIDFFLSELQSFSNSTTITFTDGQQNIVFSTDGAFGHRTFREFWEFINIHPEYLNDGNFQFDTDFYLSGISLSAQDIDSVLSNSLSSSDDRSFIFSSDESPIDLGRLYSYQMVCAHYYSNDHVDFIYSADLYRQLISYYVSQYFDDAGFVPSDFTFTYNGINCYPDWLCASNFAYLIVNAELPLVYSYLDAIFSYRRSLKYMDYFTGARSQPLAVGNTTIPVSGSGVSVVDVTRNIQLQRFLNSVARVGNKMYEYMQNVFGVTPNKDMHDPSFLGHQADVVYTTEIENTGADQLSQANSVTSVFRSKGGKHSFEFDCNEFTYIIGISYYDIRRFYTSWRDRVLMHVDRFDKFNPFMQFVGDQKVFQSEYGAYSLGSYDTPISYQLRYMEYKQKLPLAVGGFANGSLPSWTFLADDSDYENTAAHNITPDFVRSKPSELDKYYLSLTGWSLGTYFHFITYYKNFVSVDRPMAYAPSIL